MTKTKIVSGGISTMAELEKDERWLREWLREQPNRLGLGELVVSDVEPAQDDDGRAFVATDDTRAFSVDVRLGEMDASAGFQLLDNWARNRTRFPDKTNVAVLVTETTGDRYRSTLETLSEHLPLVVVELQVWRGEDEAILVPHVSLSSDDVDLADAPAVKAAEAAQAVVRPEPVSAVAEVDSHEPAVVEPDGVVEAVDAVESSDDSDSGPDNKDDTGVADPWGLPPADAEASPSTGSRLLSKIGS